MKSFIRNKKIHLISIFIILNIISISTIDNTITEISDVVNKETFTEYPVNFYHHNLESNYNESVQHKKKLIEESIFKIDQEFTAHFYSLTTYHDDFVYKENNETHQIDNPSRKVRFIGIDQDYYQELQKNQYSSILSFNQSWEDFSLGMTLLSDIQDERLQNGENLTISFNEEMQIILSPNEGNISDGIYPINTLITICNMNYQKFYHLFGYHDANNDIPLFLVNKHLINTYLYGKADHFYIANILLIDQTYINNYSYMKITSEYHQILYNFGFFGIIIPHAYCDSTISPLIVSVWGGFLILPFLIFLFYSIQGLMHEFYKSGKITIKRFESLGIKRKHYQRIQYLAFGILGFFSGTIGNIIGQFVSKIVISELVVTTALLPGDSIDLSLLNSLYYGIAVIFLLILFVKKNLGRLFEQNRFDLKDHKRKEIDKKKKTRRIKRAVILFSILSILIILITMYSIIFQVFWINYEMDMIETKSDILTLFFLYFSPILVVFPLLLIHFFHKTFQLKLSIAINYFKKKKDFKEKRKKFSFRFLLWNIRLETQTLSNFIKLFMIIVLNLSILLNLNVVYSNSIDIYYSAVSANGELISCKLSEGMNLSQLHQKIQHIDSSLKSAEDLKIEEINYIFQSAEFDTIPFQPSYKYFTTNFSRSLNDCKLPDNWFIGESGKDILRNLAAKNNSLLVPNSILNKGYDIGDTYVFKYISTTGQHLSKSGIIIGAYNMFPSGILSDIYDDDSTNLILNPELMQDIKIASFDVIIYDRNPDYNDDKYIQRLDAIYENIFSESSYKIKKIDMNQYYFPSIPLIHSLIRVALVFAIMLSFLLITLNYIVILKAKSPSQNVLTTWGVSQNYRQKFQLVAQILIHLFVLGFLSIPIVLGNYIYLIILNFTNDIAGNDILLLLHDYFKFISVIFFAEVVFFFGFTLILHFYQLKRNQKKINLEKEIRYS